MSPAGSGERVPVTTSMVRSRPTETSAVGWQALLVPQSWSLSMELMFYALAPFLARLSWRWLAAIAVPNFVRYQSQAKTSEATANVRRMFDAAVSYYNEPRIDAEASRRAKQADELVHEHPYYAVGIAAGIDIDVDVRHIDIAPTVAWLLGLGIRGQDFPDGQGFDGRVLSEAFIQFDGDDNPAEPSICGRFD